MTRLINYYLLAIDDSLWNDQLDNETNEKGQLGKQMIADVTILSINIF